MSSLASSKICHKNHRVHKNDSIYSLYKKFKPTNLPYKNFLTIVKKDNGLTRGSDIKKLNNKWISIPSKCKRSSTEKITNTFPKTKRVKTHIRRKPISITKPQPFISTRIKKLAKAHKSKTQISISNQASSAQISYKNKTYRKLKPINLELGYKAPVGSTGNYFNSSISAAKSIITQATNKNLSQDEFCITTGIERSHGSVTFISGLELDNFSLLDESFSRVNRNQLLGVNLAISHKFKVARQHFAISFLAQQSFLDLNVNEEVSRKEDRTISLRWDINDGHYLTSNISSAQINQNTIQEVGLALAMNI